jgi:FG-GAP repeat
MSSNWDIFDSNIDGTEMDSQFGHSVSLSSDGTRIAIGVPFAQLSSGAPGAVYVYEYSNGWSPLGSPIVGPGTGEQIGRAIALSGDGSTLAIGLPNHDSNLGQVRVFRWNGSSWGQYGISFIDGSFASGSGFGTSVSLSENGEILAVGAPTALNISSFTIPGAVQVYMYFDMVWQPMEPATIFGTEANSAFGQSVSLSRDATRLAVGAPGQSAGGTARGRTHIFDYDNAMFMWFGTVGVDGEANNDRSGNSISLSGDGTRLVVGAALNNGTSGLDRGNIRIFTVDSLSIIQMNGGSFEGDETEDQFGTSVAISPDGNTVVVGAPINGNPSGPGYVRAFRWSGSTWETFGNKILGELNTDLFGNSVGISETGSLLAIGTPKGAVNNPGRAAVYQQTSGSFPPPQTTTLAPTTLAPTTTLPQTTAVPTTTEDGLTRDEATEVIQYWSDIVHNN